MIACLKQLIVCPARCLCRLYFDWTIIQSPVLLRMSYREPRVPLGVFESRCALVYYWGDPSNVVANRVLIGFRHLLKGQRGETERERAKQRTESARQIDQQSNNAGTWGSLLLYVVSSRQPWHTCKRLFWYARAPRDVFRCRRQRIRQWHHPVDEDAHGMSCNQHPQANEPCHCPYPLLVFWRKRESHDWPRVQHQNCGGPRHKRLERH